MKQNLKILASSLQCNFDTDTPEMSGLERYKKKYQACRNVFLNAWDKDTQDYRWKVRPIAPTDKFLYFWPHTVVIDNVMYEGIKFRTHFISKKVMDSLRAKSWYASEWLSKDVIRFSRKAEGMRDAFHLDVCLGTGHVRVCFATSDVNSIEKLDTLVNFLDMAT